ncbi:hypothetical protein SNOG_09818 [Parastagonospora nodorum SN15]|uniref:Rhodopsin domain-containing protein n=1 Tax=Phaeosphaeria nodorum (strain SN15 / ATCC MYA-4574 / FGSC 10173) TaxID=321614 RepID=Q0UEJ6_PHANO|nr:hypothetical protein SNOG_09818 [Parastagonospora nodorum SN15]EAT83083.2 hypothetical protein SNOG_09818 [Parastagonospora nodorum SN15]
MADVAPQEWPNQRLKILIPSWTLMIISTIFVIWRVVYGLMKSRRFMLSDYLLIIATEQALNITATCTNHIVVDAGLGRHIMDPTVLPNIARYSYYLWISQVINIIAVAVLKWSICAWLLVLNFSKVYQIIVWLSILMVTALGFLAPVLTLFGCSPLEANWNFAYEPRKCWARGTLELSYTQGISNIITDVVYMAAPLIYLSKVQLSRKTQLGIRIVFLLSIPATICSIFKTVELKAITDTMDPTWDANSQSKPQYGYGYGHSTSGNIRMSTFQSSKAYHSRIPGESVLDNDSDSDRAILQEEEGKCAGIMKTTKVTVEENEASGSQSSQLSHKRSNDWPEPRAGPDAHAI